MPNMDIFNKISVSCDTFGLLDLPKFEDGKRLTCPHTIQVHELLNFLSDKLNFEKFFLKNA